MRKIVVLFGGVSAEHEVSVITGLQVIEKIDKKKFKVYPIKLTQEGLFNYYRGLLSRKDYLRVKPQVVSFGRDINGAYFQTSGILKTKIHIDAAYLAFHGGNGESGQAQGFFETLDIPYTSPNVEASSISMNKVLSKEVLERHGILTVPWVSVFNNEIRENVDSVVNKILLKVSLPVIVKPAHLGSSIAINVAETKVELKKYLLEASYIDSEILVESFMRGFVEYNIAVRKIGDNIEASEVERPLSRDEILSFADKYQRGGKKFGGMASLSRELPAKISEKMKDILQNKAIEIFRLIRAKGMVRIDFMVVGETIYVTEINPIPGSMSYYLWEASGVGFKDQITDLIVQALMDNGRRNSMKLKYDTDIVEKFVNSKDR